MNADHQEFDVEELRAVLAAALLGVDEEYEPPKVVVTIERRDLTVTGVTYDAVRNFLYIHTDEQRRRRLRRDYPGLDELFIGNLLRESIRRHGRNIAPPF